ncbi:MAG: T9SS type A sorting domain-containing protein [Crocinitomicaceae bacterium]
MKKILLSMTILAGLQATAQNKCLSHDHHEQMVQFDPNTAIRKQQMEDFTNQWIQNHSGNAKSRAAIYTIPVVVHVVYNTAGQNVSDAQILTQIDVLNKDFQLMNSDSLQPSHPFWQYTANSQIEFCLASRDPQGNFTTGITRTQTQVVSFNGNGDVKFSSTGGADNWDPTQYLNLWVCDLGASGGTLGYATFPSDLQSYPAEDGVVIHYECFGTIGTAGQGNYQYNHLGRTATHEVGHWLNLSHIWGDNQPNCGDDFVADTEPCDEPNSGYPSFPLDPNNPCGTGPNGEMYMNYMDYVDDDAMVMFTFGQSQRMHAALNGPRNAITSSNGCGAPLGIEESLFAQSFELYPNPNKGQFTIQFPMENSIGAEIKVYNLVGAEVKTISVSKMKTVQADLSNLEDGVYYLKMNSSKAGIAKKIVINR